MQSGISGRGSVSGNDVKRSRDVEPAGQRVKNVEHAGVDGLDITGTVISQNVIDSVQRSGSVHTLLTIADIQILACVSVEKRQVFFRIQATSDCGNGTGRLKGCRDGCQHAKLDESASLCPKPVGCSRRLLEVAGKYGEASVVF